MNARAFVFYGFVAASALLSFAQCSNTTAPGAPCAGSTAACPSYRVVEPSPTGSSATACPAIAIVGPTLLSPVPGATSVPTSAGTLEIASYPIKIDVLLVPYGEMPLTLGTETPAPSPAPSGTNAPTSFSYPALVAKTSYSVQYTDESGDESCPTTITSGGSFTTGS